MTYLVARQDAVFGFLAGFFEMLSLYRLALFVVPLAVSLGGTVACAQSTTAWQPPDSTFNSLEELSQAKVKPGIAYRVSERSNTQPDRTGLFYLITKPLPATFSGGTVTHTSTGRLFFRPTTQGPEIRAEWFGAVGDGVSDDTFAIQAALAYFGRVDLLDRTYGVGKGLKVSWSWSAGETLSQDANNLTQAIALEAGNKVFGMGPLRTTVKLLPNTNPRPPSRVFSIFGSVAQQDTADVIIRGLKIDVNFDGQSKDEVPPPDTLKVAHKTYSNPPSMNGIATLNAINIKGSNPLLEDLEVIGYASNTEHESFVIMTELPFNVPLVSRQCGTIRNVEMTQPGSNLEIKYRRFGRERLKTDPNYQHIAEITHVAVTGAVNFSNSQLRNDTLTVPYDHIAWSKVLEVRTLAEALTLPTLAANTIVRVLRPEPAYFSYEPNSSMRANEVSSVSLGRGLFDVSPGIALRLPRAASYPQARLTFESVTEMVDTLSRLPLSARPPEKSIIEVLNSTPESVEYYFTDYDPKPFSLSPNDYVSGSGPTKVFHFQRIPPREQLCKTWHCDPAYNSRWLGENAANIIYCEGGLVENIHIHDESMNSEGYSPEGIRYGLHDADGVNASHLHGITAAATRGLIVRNNRILNFHGIGLFIMSWWNEGITVEKNNFDGVFSGITLAAFVEDAKQKPLQFPRHRGISLKDNYIRLGDFPTSPRGYMPTGFSIIDTSNGETYPGSLPLEEYPRFESIEFRSNRVHGRPYRHVDQKKGVIYPVAAFIRSQSYLRDITIADNVVDLIAHPALIPAQNRDNQLLSTSFVMYPGHYYERGKGGRHDIQFYNNRDLVGLLADEEKVDIAFKALDAGDVRWSIPRAAPILLNDSWQPYKVGPERDPSTTEPLFQDQRNVSTGQQ